MVLGFYYYPVTGTEGGLEGTGPTRAVTLAK